MRSKRWLADLHGTGDRHVLLGVAAREAVRRAGWRLLALVPLGLAARRLGDRREPEVDRRTARAGCAANADAGVGHVARVGEDAHLAVVGDLVLLVRRDHVEPQPAGVVRQVAVDVAAA